MTAAALFKLLSGPAEEVAPRLLGAHLIRELGGETLKGKIVEVEAYDQTDPASHSFRGLTPRTAIMFGPPGHLYVYFTYGMHYCCNIVTGASGHGSAVLIRAVEPLAGEAAMSLNRRGLKGVLITNGPAKVCQAFAIDKQLNGHDLSCRPLRLELQPAVASDQVVQATRIGISRAQDQPWRFYLRGNPYVSNVT